MEECCTRPKNDSDSYSSSTSLTSISNSELVNIDVSFLDDESRKRHRRKLRMDYIRSKRAKLAATGGVVKKRPRQDPVFTCFNFFPCEAVPAPTSAEQSTPLDAAKLRQLKNRESAERSRLKKDNLIDSLTCQVCECYVQLADLMAEQQWLHSAQHAVNHGLPIPGYPQDSASDCYSTSSSSSSSVCSASSSAASPATSGCSSPVSGYSSSRHSSMDETDSTDRGCYDASVCSSSSSSSSTRSGLSKAAESPRRLSKCASTDTESSSSGDCWGAEDLDLDFDSVIDNFDELMEQAQRDDDGSFLRFAALTSTGAEEDEQSCVLDVDMCF